MDFALSAAQEDLRQRVADFARAEQFGKQGPFDRSRWRRCAETGLLGALAPPEHGGLGLDLVSTVAMLEALGTACPDNGFTLAVSGQLWSIVKPLTHYASPEQAARYLPKLCSGEWIGAHGVTEQDSGSDAFAMKTRATRTADGYRLTGTKRYIGLAPVAQLALVFASTAPERGRWGISAFLVECDSPGVTLRSLAPSGLAGNPLGEIGLDDVLVPEANRLGPEGAGASLFSAGIEFERAFVLAAHLGAMQRQLDDTVRYARERRQFGKAIGDFQSVSNRIADMKLRHETARLLLYKVAWMKDNGETAAVESALSNLHLAESFLASSVDAVRIHGAAGYLDHNGVATDTHDALAGVIYAGTSDIMRNLVAKHLGV